MRREETTFWLSQLIPAELDFGEDAAVADLDDGQQVAVTVGFADVDTGLVAVEGGADVRSELITVARAERGQLTAVLRAAATLLADANGLLPAQPGTMIPHLAEKAGLQGISVAHGLFIPPYLWGGETPRFTEEGRLTVLLQLVMLTDAEYAYAVEEGPGGLQQALGEAGIDLLDWGR
ncbi:hypothetical protein EAH68_05685 [Corynebacterium hylobatis]|uniref:Suppressor of fused-like domain-containing protein n=1 Tax=Corynebacterium hylobatis TaxID=1859290 RepID=A0A430HZY1_9CORY|nr:suppressor of fused domain protein [Corynebacterium hylobatis]RSZ64477.1 hypothetical protein EAH68_05685 [Corynebacterium hylobatis]